MTASGSLGFDIEDFLQNTWQKKPLLVRNAFPGGLTHVDGDMLAGLACHDGVESRLVLERGDYPWQTKHGPFEERVFSELPPSHWSLLVQAVDRLLPEVSRLKQLFRFLPNWRVDDIMISYAPDQGSVGPHTDHYDVFLIQGQGRRRWDIHANPPTHDDFIPDLDLKILRKFEPDLSYVLEAGDMLYLPPRLGHHGVALGESITYSVGFRAPTQKELLLSYAQYLSQSAADEIFFADERQGLAGEPGLISENAIERLRRLMLNAIEDGAGFHQWIGGFLTEPRTFHEAPADEREAASLLKAMRKMDSVDRVEGGRFAYHRRDKALYFAVEGESLLLPAELEPLVAHLCREDTYKPADILAFAKIDGFNELIEHLWNRGYIREGEG